jgi:hypothetical protein
LEKVLTGVPAGLLVIANFDFIFSQGLKPGAVAHCSYIHPVFWKILRSAERV